MATEKLKNAIGSLLNGESAKFVEAIKEDLAERKAKVVEREYIAHSVKNLGESVETIGHALMVADMTRDLDLDGEDDDEEEIEIDVDIEDIAADVRAAIAGEKDPNTVG
ncbi:hypothetical protein phiOC_p033 [Ochrobactrum phage vB_OspM_OC]|nr:hypothetical protein phiOC_p033 [Ochrobactrum phage vB_OspM_OC]